MYETINTLFKVKDSIGLDMDIFETINIVSIGWVIINTEMTHTKKTAKITQTVIRSPENLDWKIRWNHDLYESSEI